MLCASVEHRLAAPATACQVMLNWNYIKFGKEAILDAWQVNAKNKSKDHKGHRINIYLPHSQISEEISPPRLGLGKNGRRKSKSKARFKHIVHT